jgi:hypothetical protein
MSKTFKINIKKLQDPTGSKQDVKENKTRSYILSKTT